MKVVDCGFCHKEIAVSDNKFRESEDSIEILCPWCNKNLNYSKSDFKERHDYFSPLHQSSLSKESKFTFDISIWIKGLVILLIAGFFFYMFIEKIRTGSLVDERYKITWPKNNVCEVVTLDRTHENSRDIWSNGSFIYCFLVNFISIPMLYYLYLDIEIRGKLGKIFSIIILITISILVISTFLYIFFDLIESISRYNRFGKYRMHVVLSDWYTDNRLQEDQGTSFWVSIFCVLMLLFYYFPIFGATYDSFKKKT